jgi:hypothetical protein
MVKSKKDASGTDGSSEQPISEDNFVPVNDESVVMEAPEEILAPAIFETDQDIIRKLQQLLNDAPRRPEFIKIEDAVSFADVYDKWYRKVAIETQ